ncbi:hypothetical protein T8S45_07175 [Blastomonas marina]|uniref:hypothetical protein n=1 Tax=Blastomonas marina TaxID=1867408 RepID=UPI002AC924CB|nr:hypothetical protein [Blastomonas marina]WPZ02637.1 hypothetical protein T8S45_07175 [Blastomonas marina]
MSKAHDSSPIAQTRRNLQSDLRFSWGCQLGFAIYALTLFVPLGLLALFSESIPIFHLTSSIFSIALAVAANLYRKRAEEQTLRRAIAAWVVVIAPIFALIFLLLGLSLLFGF